MIAILLAWTYIFLLSFCWGIIFLQLCAGLKSNNNKFIEIHFSIICLTGLATITAFCSVFSLFTSIGGWVNHLLIGLPCLTVIRAAFSRTKHIFRNLNYPGSFKLIAAGAISIILLMASWVIEHADTLTYQVQIIKWMEEFGLVPGIVNINARLGLQNLWFCLTGFFSLKFTAIGHYVYLNSFVALLVVLFIMDRIHTNHKKGNNKEAFLWLLLFFTAFLSYNQIRLTSSSTSSDYICAVYILAAFYLIYNAKGYNQASVINIFILFSFFSVAVKLSAIPIFFAAILIIFREIKTGRIKHLIVSLTVSFLLLGSFAVRNVVSSGYVLYPSPIPDVFSYQWKQQKKKVEQIASYITIYARIQDSYTEEKMNQVKEMSFKQWGRIWWHQRKLIDQALIVVLLISFCRGIYRLPKLWAKNKDYFILYFTSLTGVAFWFLNAPDPRFGYGFILALIGLEAMTTPWKAYFVSICPTLTKAGSMLLGLTFSGYIIYRCINYVEARQILIPLGIEKIPTTSVICNGTAFNIATSQGCGDTELPCIENPCETFEQIGNDISEGFKSKN